MNMLEPKSPQELADALGRAAASGQSIRTGGAFTKDAMGGPIASADATITTRCMTRLLQYEPKDLTISVEAGMPFSQLSALLAENRQMVPLDPPFAATATIGGVLAANSTGARRRLYGAARDLVIGMKFATLEGKLVDCGGMVVKNVAGLDMAKLMIGSYGTLAAIASANFKLIPMPPITRTYAMGFDSAAALIQARNAILAGTLQPAALDVLNPAASALIGLDGFMLLLRAGGSKALVERYDRELAHATKIEGDEESALWTRIQELTPAFLAANPAGAVHRLARLLMDIEGVLAAAEPVLARGGSGVCYRYLAEAPAQITEGLIEAAPPMRKSAMTLWPAPGSDFETMEKVKLMFDPKRLLNAGRLHGRI